MLGVERERDLQVFGLGVWGVLRGEGRILVLVVLVPVFGFVGFDVFA